MYVNDEQKMYVEKLFLRNSGLGGKRGELEHAFSGENSLSVILL